jgi:hypothetical protein
MMRAAHIKRWLLRAFLVLMAVVSSGDMLAQSEPRERKRLWRRWRSNRQSYNPYLEKKKKDKPSAKLAREQKRDLKRQNRAAKRQLRRSKRTVRAHSRNRK